MPDDAFFARARAAAQRLMVDTCTIVRDPGFLSDSELDENTGALTPGDPATVEVYAGPCKVTPAARQDQTEEGGAPVVRRSYRATIPVDADEVTIGDILTVASSVRDPLLAGQSFVVDGILRSTHAFQRRLSLELAVRADAQ